MFRRFCQSTSGNFAIMFALLLPVLLAAVGLALDLTNLMKARSDLQNALDSAVLAASRLSDMTGSRQDTFDAFFSTNIASRPALANARATLEIEEAVNSIKSKATAEADVALTFGFLFGPNATVKAQSNAFESTAKLEVALVLDNTGSMGSTNMKALIDGSKEVIKSLQKAKTDRPERMIRAALVPFVTAVNIKSTVGFDQSWIDNRQIVPETDPSTNGKNFAFTTDAKGNKARIGHRKLFDQMLLKTQVLSRTDWKGCVEARTGKLALDDTAPDPALPETLFVPYFAPDEPGSAVKSPNSGSAYNNSYLPDPAKTPDGKTPTDTYKQQDLAKYSNAGDNALIKETPNDTTGPNYACATPVVPLTEDLVKLVGDPVKKTKGELDNMNFWYGSGTNVSEGLAWGYRVLSPGAPFTQGDKFGEKDTTKVVVVFTDGENNVFGGSSGINKSDYGSYGYLSQGRMGATDNATALKNVNTSTQTVCTSLKDKEVTVYTVVLGADTTANRNLYSKCATTPSHYFPAKNATELKAAFQTIANSISSLYITN